MRDHAKGFARQRGDYDSDYYGAIQIDNLSYSYDRFNKNQLIKVTDATNSPKGFKDDSDGTLSGTANSVTTDDYSYDANGNMLIDENKGITSIKYNHLNLPVQINFGADQKIEYLYDAAGQKKSKKVIQGPAETITDYLDGYQYSNQKLNFFPHAEGYVNATYCETCVESAQVKYNYVYQYKDHLGNIRVSYGYDEKYEVLKIIEENNYYPFGLKHSNYNSGKKKPEIAEEDQSKIELKQVTPTDIFVPNNYKYNSKEWQDELGLNMYDYGARNYDPAIGRWINIDPLAEIYHTDSPYSYVMDNPLSYIDPNGRRLLGVTKDDAKNIHDDINTVFADSKFDKVRGLFTRGEKNNKKAFDKIDKDALKDALSGLTGDDLALAELVTGAVNSSVEYKVEYVEDGKELSSEGQTAFNDYVSKVYTNLGHRAPDSRIRTETDIIIAGGEGYTVPTSNGSHSFIVNDKNTQYGEGLRALTTFHETFGHGVAAGQKVADFINATNAIRADNLVRRVLQIKNQRDGSDHNGGRVPNPQALPIIKN